MNTMLYLFNVNFLNNNNRCVSVGQNRIILNRARNLSATNNKYVIFYQIYCDGWVPVDFVQTNDKFVYKLEFAQGGGMISPFSTRRVTTPEISIIWYNINVSYFMFLHFFSVAWYCMSNHLHVSIHQRTLVTRPLIFLFVDWNHFYVNWTSYAHMCRRREVLRKKIFHSATTTVPIS